MSDGEVWTAEEFFAEIRPRVKRLVHRTGEGKGQVVLGEIQQDLCEILRMLDREARRLNLRNCERCGKAAIDPAFDEFESEWLMMMTAKSRSISTMSGL